MNPSYIYFKELDIDSENIFSLNFFKENEIENVFLDNDFEYAITGIGLLIPNITTQPVSTSIVTYKLYSTITICFDNRRWK